MSVRRRTRQRNRRLEKGRPSSKTKRAKEEKLRQHRAQVKNRYKRPESPSLKKPSRNDPCPCGSGRKYKYCCMRSTKENTQCTTGQLIEKQKN